MCKIVTWLYYSNKNYSKNNYHKIWTMSSKTLCEMVPDPLPSLPLIGVIEPQGSDHLPGTGRAGLHVEILHTRISTGLFDQNIYFSVVILGQIDNRLFLSTIKSYVKSRRASVSRSVSVLTSHSRDMWFSSGWYLSTCPPTHGGLRIVTAITKSSNTILTPIIRCIINSRSMHKRRKHQKSIKSMLCSTSFQHPSSPTSVFVMRWRASLTTAKLPRPMVRSIS